MSESPPGLDLRTIWEAKIDPKLIGRPSEKHQNSNLDLKEWVPTGRDHVLHPEPHLPYSVVLIFLEN